MEQTAETTAVEREIAIAASPETVWEFFVDAEKLNRWIGSAATADAREGGAFRFEVGRGHVAAGEFVELDPPHRLVYTFGWEPDGNGPNNVPVGSSTIEVELVPDGDGTVVHFTHRDLPGAESAASHTIGWEHYLARLAIVAAGGDPGRDPWIDGAL